MSGHAFKLADAPADLDPAEAALPNFKRQLAWCRQQIATSLESIALANGATPEQAAAHPVVVAARAACDELDADVAKLEASVALVRAHIAAHPDQLAQPAPAPVFQAWGRVNTGMRSVSRKLDALVEQLRG